MTIFEGTRCRTTKVNITFSEGNGVNCFHDFKKKYQTDFHNEIFDPILENAS